MSSYNMNDGIREDDLVAVVEQRVAEKLEQIVHAVAHSDLLDGPPEALTQRLPQVQGVAVRIAVDLVERRHHRGLDFGEGRQRELVGGQLHHVLQPIAPHDGLDRGAGRVGDDALDLREESHGFAAAPPGVFFRSTSVPATASTTTWSPSSTLS